MWSYSMKCVAESKKVSFYSIYFKKSRIRHSHWRSFQETSIFCLNILPCYSLSLWEVLQDLYKICARTHFFQWCLSLIMTRNNYISQVLLNNMQCTIVYYKSKIRSLFNTLQNKLHVRIMEFIHTCFLDSKIYENFFPLNYIHLCIWDSILLVCLFITWLLWEIFYEIHSVNYRKNNFLSKI